MNTYKQHRFPPDIISYAVWLYHRFNLSHGDIEDHLAERGITVSRESERGMRRFKSPKQAQRFLGVHAAVYNLINLGRHLVSADHYRNLGTSAFNNWKSAVA